MPIDKVIVKKITAELRQPTGTQDSPDYIPPNRGVEVEYALMVGDTHSGATGKAAVLSSAARALLAQLWDVIEADLNGFLLGNTSTSNNRAVSEELPPLVPISTED